MEKSVENLTIPFLEASQSCHISKILGPIDGSERSFNALEFAVDLSAKYNSEICLVHAIPTHYLNLWLKPIECAFYPEGLFIPPNVLQEMEDESERLLMSTLKLAQNVSIKSYARIGQDRPANEIAKIAMEENVDFVMIVSNNPSIFAGLLFGSVSETVVHKVPCLVLVVRNPQMESEPQEASA